MRYMIERGHLGKESLAYIVKGLRKVYSMPENDWNPDRIFRHLNDEELIGLEVATEDFVYDNYNNHAGVWWVARGAENKDLPKVGGLFILAKLANGGFDF